MNVPLQRRQLFALLTLLLVAAFSATTISGYIVARDSIRNNIVERELPLTGDSIYSEIQRDILRPVFVSEQMAQNTFLRDWTLNGEKDRAQLLRYLSEIKDRYGAVTSFYVSTNTSNYYHPSGIQKTVSEQDTKDKWFYRVRDMREPYEINVEPDSVNRDNLTAFINYRVLDYQGKFIGVTGVGLSSKNLASLIEQYEAKFHRRIAFANADGQLMLVGKSVPYQHGTIRELPGIKSVAEGVLNKSPVQTRLVYETDGVRWHLNSRYIPELKWYLLIEQDETGALEALNRVFWFNVAIGLLATLAALGLVLFTVRRFQTRLEQMAMIDNLTGIQNRQTGEAMFQRAVNRSQRNAEPMSILVLDVDRFKEVNDAHGHQAGDRVIMKCAELIRSMVRSSDIVARWGGEEFVAVLHQTSLAEAVDVANKIRLRIEEHHFRFGGVEVNKTISIGAAQLLVGEVSEVFFARADKALLKAKQSGRNQVQT